MAGMRPAWAGREKEGGGVPAAITSDLGSFLAGMQFQRLPSEAVRIAKLGIVDSIGVLFAGRMDSAPRILLDALAPGSGTASVLFTSRRAAPTDAALINGAAAHALDYDDVAMRGHPSCVIVPAILAEGESSAASGEQLIAAYVAAYEVWAELVLRDPDPQHLRGWHLTGWIGAVAAAAACAVLRGLSADQCATALSIAASQSAGLMANAGTMTKPFHAGRAAQSGVLAARLAERGFSAAPDGLENSAGWLRAVSSSGRVDLEAPVTAGSHWRIEQVGLAIRRHPTCYVGHRLIDGVLELVERTKLDAGQVSEIHAYLGRTNADILRYHRPSNPFQAKFSAEFGIAAAILRGRVALSELDDEFVRSDAVQSLMARILVEAKEASAIETQLDYVKVRTRSGEEFASEPPKALQGSHERPLSPEDLRAKFTDCVRHGTQSSVDGEFIDSFWAKLSGFERIADVRELRAFAC